MAVGTLAALTVLTGCSDTVRAPELPLESSICEVGRSTTATNSNPGFEQVHVGLDWCSDNDRRSEGDLVALTGELIRAEFDAETTTLPGHEEALAVYESEDVLIIFWKTDELPSDAEQTIVALDDLDVLDRSIVVALVSTG